MKRFFFAVCLIVLCGCAKDIIDFTGDIQGVVKDYNDGNLIANCQISLSPSGESTLSDSQGTFYFNGLTPGEYTLVFNKAGYEKESKKVVVVSGQITEATQLLKAKSPFSISETLLDFGDLEKTKTVSLFNNTDSECSYRVSNIPNWISLSSSQGYVSAESTSSLTINIDKDALDYGEHTQTIIFTYNGKSSGDVNLVIKCKKVHISEPTVTCEEYAKNITQTSFEITGTIEATGGQQVTSYGHCWSTTPNPTISNNKSNNGATTSVGEFVSNVTGLSSRTTYYVRAYAENASGVAYSNEVVISTQGAQCDKWDGSKANSFAKGKGNAADPYIIETGAQLVLMKDYPSKHFKLNKDIDLDNHIWPSMDLSGTFDGNGHTIYNLKPSCNDKNIGFISTLSGTLKNLTIDSVNIDAEGLDNVGAFVGILDKGSVNNCTLNLNSDSLIQGSYSVGGIVGNIKYEGGSIKNCTVNSSSQDIVIIGENRVGGIFGESRTTSSTVITYENCHVQANIYGNDCVGGICGYSSEAIFHNCYYTGNITGDYEVGGIAGNGHNSEFQGCKVDANITVSDDMAGGISGDGWCKIIGCYTNGTMTCSNSSVCILAGLAASSGHRPDAYLCYSTMTSTNSYFYGLGKYVTPVDCATVSSMGTETNTGKISCTNITDFLQSTYSSYADYYNFNNTWTWTGKINGATVNVSCPKLAWEK